jgi:hypothetical protein
MNATRALVPPTFPTALPFAKNARPGKICRNGVAFDNEIDVRRVRRTQMNVTRALALPKEQHERENK